MVMATTLIITFKLERPDRIITTEQMIFDNYDFLLKLMPYVLLRSNISTGKKKKTMTKLHLIFCTFYNKDIHKSF